jgi:hypothetical protein
MDDVDPIKEVTLIVSNNFDQLFWSKIILTTLITISVLYCRSWRYFKFQMIDRSLSNAEWGSLLKWITSPYLRSDLKNPKLSTTAFHSLRPYSNPQNIKSKFLTKIVMNYVSIFLRATSFILIYYHFWFGSICLGMCWRESGAHHSVCPPVMAIGKPTICRHSQPVEHGDLPSPASFFHFGRLKICH